MTTYIVKKFGSQLDFLWEAVNGESDLRTNQKLYKKICKYYKEQGITFPGDAHFDYDTVLDCLYEDINL